MASAVIGALRVNLGIDSAAFSKGLASAQKGLKAFGASAQRIGSNLSTFVTLPLLGIGTAAIQAAGEAEKATASVRQALESMGEGAGFSLEQLQRMAAGLQSVSAFDDDDIMSKVTANLLTFGKVQGDVFERAQQSALDLSARLGTDLQSSAIMLGKALNDPVKGISALTRVGVAFTAQQKEQIKAMAQAGDVAGAQSLILAELEKQYGGQALAQAGTVLGQQAQAWNAIGDAMEAVGAVILPVIAKLAGYVKTAAEAFSALSPKTQEWVVIVGALAAALGPVVLTIGIMATALAAIGAPIALAVAGLVGLTAGLVAFLPQINAMDAALRAFGENIRTSLAAAWDTMLAKIAEVKIAITAFATSLLDAFKALPAQMLEIGSAIIQGLWDGLKSKFAAVKDSMTGFAVGLYEDFKGVFRVQSPSKVMHEVGTNIMQGLGDGMNSMQSGIGSIADSIASTIGGAFRSVIDGSKSVKEAISDVLKSLAEMLLNSAFKSLAGAAGGGGGFLGSLFGGLFGGGLPGFANGGSFNVGGAGGIDSQVVAFRASPNERVSVTKPGQERGGASGVADVRVYVDENGNWQAKVEQISQRTASGVTRQGLATYDKQLNRTIGGKLANAQARQM